MNKRNKIIVGLLIFVIVVFLAQLGLRKFAANRVLNQYITYLESSDSQKYWQGFVALKLAGDRAVPKLLKTMDTDNAKLCIDVITLLGFIKNEKATPKLIKCLNDKEWRIRFFSAQSLGKIGDKRASIPLVEAFRDEKDWKVRREVTVALAEINDSASMIPLQKINDKIDDVDTKVFTALILYKLTAEGKYFEQIKGAIYSDIPSLQRKTMFTLADIGGKDMINLLNEFASTIADPELKEFTTKVIERLEEKSKNI